MKPLRDCIPFKTEKGNRYLCARERRHLLLCHPVLYHIVQLGEQGVDLESWVESVPAHGIVIEKSRSFSREEVLYYYKKYLFLKEWGYLTHFYFENRFDLKINPKDIRRALANVRQVIFEVTDACNLRCEYCGYGRFYKDYDRRKDQKLDIQAAKRLLDYLVKLWDSGLNTSVDTPIAVGFYGGEPLLNFRFIEEMVAYVETLNLPRQRFLFTMTTNALLLKKHMDFLHENRFELLISLDGDRRHNSYRIFPNGSEAYDKTLRNILALKKAYPEYFDEKVNFSVVFHNRSSYREIYSYFKKRFNKIPVISELNTSGVDPSRKDEFLRTYADMQVDFQGEEQPQAIFQDMFLDLPGIGGLSKFIHKYSDCCFSDYNQALSPAYGSKRLLTGTCIPFSRKIFVTVNKKILACEKIGQQYALGAVTEEGVNIDMEKIAETYNDYLLKMAGQCRTCHLADNCGQCMFFLNLEKDKPACRRFMTLEERKKFFSSYMSYLEETPGAMSRILGEVIDD